ncbi:protein FAM200B-like [Octopus sinensis]|uniref:Protein FAM200B-like n=1 Tax=Octopus sinensis TaxID=2607531 RepID=A0A6P7TUK8_9MOLL|nr:protein FAM200B-like [Octopus sinensis]
MNSSNVIKIRKYNPDYIKYGFICIDKDGFESPKCVVCMKILSHNSMKPTTLVRHLRTCHPHLIHKNKDYFISLRKMMKNQVLTRFIQTLPSDNSMLLASYMISLRIAKEKKPHNIAEKLILPCCKDIVRTLIGTHAENMISEYHYRMILFIDEFLKCQKILSVRLLILYYLFQVVEQIKTSCHQNFAIQVDESTDVANCAQLIIFARYVYDGDFKEEFLFSYSLESTTKGEDIFQTISMVFDSVGLSWKK